MKKIMVALLAVVMTLSLLAGCGSAPAKSGIGTVVNLLNVDYTGQVKPGFAQADVTTASVTIDGSGKVVTAEIDTVQVMVQFGEDNELTTPLDQEFKTKKELGLEYGMKNFSGIEKEWDEQIVELEKWMVGKTLEQIKGMSTETLEETGYVVPAEADLKTSVTIDVSAYLAAVEKAFAEANK